MTYTATGLTEGADYYFRVVAVNDAGPGAPGVTEPVTVKEPEGTNSFCHSAIVNKWLIINFYLDYFYIKKIIYKVIVV